MEFDGPDFDDVLGAKLHVPTGMLFTGVVNYKNGEPVTTWKESGFTFIPVVVTDGITVREKQNIQFATKETADKVAAFYVENVLDPGWSIVVKERGVQDEIFWAEDRRTGKKVHMFQLWIKSPDGKILPPANPGLDANTIARNPNPEWAALMFKDSIRRNMDN